MNTEKELLYKELTVEIIKSAYNVHNILGCGLRIPGLRVGLMINFAKPKIEI